MKVTIITAVYNSMNHIGDAIQSVLSQNYPDIEYIVIDGGSTDGTLSVVKQYEGRISKIISEPDKGLYDALNKGIKLATGDYIGFVHSDDMLFDDYVISRIVNHIKKTRCDVFYGDGIFVSAQNTKMIVRNWIGGKYSKQKVRTGWLPLHPTMYIKRDVYLKHGLYDISYKIAGDTDLLVRYLYKENLSVSYLHKYIIRMRMGGVSTSVGRTKDKWTEDMRIYRSHGLSSFCLVGKVARKIPQFLSFKSISSRLKKLFGKF